MLTAAFIFFVKTTTRLVSGRLGIMHQATCFCVCAHPIGAAVSRHERTLEFHHAHAFAQKREALALCVAVQAKSKHMTAERMRDSDHWNEVEMPSLAERWLIMAEERGRLEDDMMAGAPVPKPLTIVVQETEEEDPPWLRELERQAEKAA